MTSLIGVAAALAGLVIWDLLAAGLLLVLPPGVGLSVLPVWSRGPSLFLGLALAFLAMRWVGQLTAERLHRRQPAEVDAMREASQVNRGAPPRSLSGIRSVTHADVSAEALDMRRTHRWAPRMRVVAIILVALATWEAWSFIASINVWWTALIVAIVALALAGGFFLYAEEMDSARLSFFKTPLPDGSTRGWLSVPAGVWMGAQFVKRLSVAQAAVFLFVGGWWSTAGTRSAAEAPQSASVAGVFAASAGWPLLTLTLLLAPLLAVDSISRWSARRARDVRSTFELTPGSDGRFILYLRSFDEDDLRLSVQLSRAFVVHQVSPILTPRFEELLSACFAEEIQLVAVAPPSEEVARLGAARVAYTNDDWREGVDGLVGRCSGILISATPASLNDGLAWELGRLMSTAGAIPWAFVLAPWPVQERMDRFAALRRALADMPFFEGIDRVRIHAGTLMVFRYNGTWRTISCDRDDESAYVTAVSNWSSLVFTTFGGTKAAW